jgi:hypothetical protein
MFFAKLKGTINHGPSRNISGFNALMRETSKKERKQAKSMKSLRKKLRKILKSKLIIKFKDIKNI